MNKSVDNKEESSYRRAKGRKSTENHKRGTTKKYGKTEKQFAFYTCMNMEH
jgi:hypothetical protein